MNRLDFLKSLAAIGAAFTLPLDAIATAPDSAIDRVWHDATASPVVFYVREYGAITTRPTYDPLPDSDSDDEDYVEDIGQQEALAFFQAECEYNELLGIRLLARDGTGNDYYVAELRGSIQNANALAEHLALPIRFAWLGF